MNPNKPWRDKVNKIIYSLCQQSYLKANRLKDGKMRRRHVPYSIPAEAECLIDCLNKDDEVRAKSLMMWDYEIRKANDALSLYGV